MRTSRISNLSSHPLQIHRRVGPNVDANVFSNMQQGFQQNSNKKKSQTSQRKAGSKKLSNSKGHLLMKGILLQGEQGALIHNQLLHNAHILHFSTKMKVRNQIYRDSI